MVIFFCGAMPPDYVLHCEPTDLLRLLVLVLGTAFLLRLTYTGRKRVVGRPRIDWAQALIEILSNFTRCSIEKLLDSLTDKLTYQFTVERLCRHASPASEWIASVGLF